MDKALEEKVHAAMTEAVEEAKRRGLFLAEIPQFIADFLINHPDPDVVAFQERHNRHVRRDLN
jgi:hypothetical protein